MNTSTFEQISFGIIGFGRFAKKWILPSLKHVSQARLAAICSRNASKAELPDTIKIFPNYEDMLNDSKILAIYVASPNGLHFEHASKALRKKKHVLCEKPMAVSPNECITLIELAKKNKCIFHVGHVLRFSKAIEKVKEMIEQGMIGSPRYVHSYFSYMADSEIRSWIYDPQLSGGGPLLDAGIHCLDTIRFLLNSEVSSGKIEKIQNSISPSLEKTAMCILSFKNDCMASIITSHDAAYGHGLEITGTQGKISICEFAKCKGLVTIKFEFHRGYDIKAASEEYSIDDTHPKQITSFCNSILSEDILNESAINGLKNVEIIHQLYHHGFYTN